MLRGISPRLATKPSHADVKTSLFKRLLPNEKGILFESGMESVIDSISVAYSLLSFAIQVQGRF